jgi:hypothetical protein
VVAILSWKKIRSGVYHATSPWGLYTIDGEGAGRNRWTVTYPDSDYGMVDSLAEAKAWAAQDAEARASKRPNPPAHAAKRRAYDINPTGPEVIKAFLRTGRPATEDEIQDFISDRYGDWMRQLKRRYPDIDATEEWDTIIREFTAGLVSHGVPLVPS